MSHCTDKMLKDVIKQSIMSHMESSGLYFYYDAKTGVVTVDGEIHMDRLAESVYSALEEPSLRIPVYPSGVEA